MQIERIERIERIESLDDPRVSDFRNVKDAHLRSDRGCFVVEGRRNVRHLLEGELFGTRAVFGTEKALASLGDALPSFRGRVFSAPQATLNGVVGYNMHRGCLATGERGGALSVESLLATFRGESSLVVALDGLTDSENVGGVFRNAMAFGADGVLLCPRCCDPLYRKALRVSMGGALRVPFARCCSWRTGLASLRDAGYRIAALDPRQGAPELSDVDDAEALRRFALLLGNENDGLSDAALELADLRVRIPMAPRVDSLNVATASGIALHHAFARSRAPAGARGAAA